ncbi:MAG: metal ABC transporter permease [Planctomycetia bacterium]|nr:metal ABC transporter permease [Planctomycetia bacterium]
MLGVAFGVGIALLSGLSARGIPGAGGLEQFLMGHTAALTVDDAKSLAVASLAAVLCAGLAVKEATLVAFDPAFAAASGWPVTLIDYCLVGLVALMVVVGLPAAGAVLVTALVVIPPVTARQWTDRVPMMLVLAGCIGLAAAIGGVALSAAVPKLPTGPTIVLVAASLFAVSFLAAPGRGWLARRREVRDTERTWVEGRLLCAALEATDAHPGASFGRPEVEARAGSQRGKAAAWDALVRRGAFVPLRDAGNHWRLSPAGRAAATERAQRIAAWGRVLAERPADARGLLTIDLPAPEAVLGAERAVGRAEN